MVIYISDFDLVASGYMQLSIALCNGLAQRGKKIMALGLGYNGSEHNWPFSIIPVRSEAGMALVKAMWQNLNALSQAGEIDHIEAIVAALDIPYQARLVQIIKGQQEALNRPYIGIFPVESGPLCMTWANILAPMQERLVISQFGLQQMTDAKVDGTFLPLGIDISSWRRPQPGERKALRKALGFEEGQFVVLTVADNQERKNLWAGARTIADLAKTHDAYWALVTRVNSPFGWRMDELAQSLGITERMMLFDRGLPFDRLWTLYAAADAFLLPSKAEGFGMPLIEAMACGVPVVATDCTACTEQIYDDYPANMVARGFPIGIEYQHVDVWGNSVRSWADAASAANHLRTIAAWKQAGDPQLEAIIERGLAYAASRTWDRAIDVLDGAIERVKQPVVGPPPPVLPGLMPMTVPRPIPVMPYFDDGEPDEQASP